MAVPCLVGLELLRRAFGLDLDSRAQMVSGPGFGNSDGAKGALPCASGLWRGLSSSRCVMKVHVLYHCAARRG